MHLSKRDLDSIAQVSLERCTGTDTLTTSALHLCLTGHKRTQSHCEWYSYFQALELVKSKTAGIELVAIALRWMQHHSKLTPEDGVIIGMVFNLDRRTSFIDTHVRRRIFSKAD